MKINELIKTFEIYTSLEEKKILDKISSPCYVDMFSEREQKIIENLIRKSLIVKLYNNGQMIVAPNEKS